MSMKFGVQEQPDDGDEVIARYNVYSSYSLQHQLHIFQFPLRRRMRPYEANDVRLFVTEGTTHGEKEQSAETGREADASPPAPWQTGTTVPSSSSAPAASVLRPLSRLTMHCRIDTFGSSSFGQPRQVEPDDALGRGNQQRRHSYNYALQSHPFRPRCDYAVGFIVDGAIHITPVSTIQQFSPIVRPIVASVESAHRVDDAFVSTPSTTTVPGLAVSDRLNREIVRQRSVMLNSDAATAREVQYFPIESVESMAMRRRLCTPTYEMTSNTEIKRVSQQANVRIEDGLFPPELLVSGGITGGEDAVAGCGTLLQRYAYRHSVLDQVLVLLQRCQVLTLTKLHDLVVLPDKDFFSVSTSTRHQQQQQQQQQDCVTDGQLLEALREGAVWIHGVWVSKATSHFKGTVAALREVVLLYFFESANATVSRAELNKLVNNAALRRVIKEVLQSLASLNNDEPDPTKRVWRLLHVPSEPVMRERLLHSSYSVYPEEVAFQRMQWERMKPYIMAHLKAINGGQPVSRLLLTVQRREGSDKIAAITGGAAAAAAVGSAGSMSFKEEELAPIIAYIQRIFLEHGVLNKQCAKEMVVKARQQHYPDATNPMLSAAMQRCVRPFTSATWVLKTLGEPEVDRYRPLIIDTALELVNFEMRFFQGELEKRRSQRPSSERIDGAGAEDMQKAVSRVLAEVGVYKQHERLWHLKSGNVVSE